MVFNELSIKTSEDIYIARQWMEIFIKTIIRAHKKGVGISQDVGRTIYTNIDFNGILLASKYPLSRWRNDNGVEKEIRSYMRSITTNRPILDELSESEFSYEGQIAIGLGVANLLGAIAISFQSDDCWNQIFINLTKYLVSDDDIDEKTIQINHASQPSHIEDHSEWIVERQQQDVKDGIDLWNRRDELFPSLVFCESLVEQIQNLDSVMLHPVARKLFDFKTYCVNWASGDFDGTQLPMKITTESEATLNKYGDQRTFLCPDGERRIFHLHARITPKEWRIYFIPLPQIRKIIIGYIGPHLDTVK